MTTTLPPLATVADLEEHLGRDLDEAEQTRAEPLLAAASARVRRFTRRDFPNGAPDDVVAIVCQMVGRSIGRPADETALRQEAIAGYSYTVGAAASAGPVGLLADEKEALRDYRKPAGTVHLL